MIASFLVKDPSKRPTAKKLLKHALFKQARSNDYISRALLEGLPSLGDRVKALKNEYKRGISGWNFNLEDLKAHASLATPESLAATQPLPPDPTLVNLFSESIFLVLQNVLQATTIGRESIISAMRQVNRGDSTVDAGCIPSNSAGVEKSLLEAALEREKDLHREIADLWWRLKRAQEELQKYKTENKSSK